jgi:signal transduction histidine kinase
MARFYAGIAHEIRSPLASISNFISMLPDRFDDPEYRDTAARILPSEVARIVRLADRVRSMAPSEGGKLTAISIESLLTDLVALHAPEGKAGLADVRLNCDSPIPNVLGDSSQLTQLFVNLLRNAVEAMPHGGLITIEVFSKQTSTVVIRVIDEGVGLDPSSRTKLFEPFFTTKSSGTGLGLSICREIATFHRAQLSLTSRTNGRGTIAQVEFPSLSPVGISTDASALAVAP